MIGLKIAHQITHQARTSKEKNEKQIFLRLDFGGHTALIHYNQLWKKCGYE